MFLDEAMVWWTNRGTRPLLPSTDSVEIALTKSLFGDRYRDGCNGEFRDPLTREIKAVVCTYLARGTQVEGALNRLALLLASKKNEKTRDLIVTQLTLLLTTKTADDSLSWLAHQTIEIDLDNLAQSYIARGDYVSGSSIAREAVRVSRAHDARSCGRNTNLTLVELLRGAPGAAAVALSATSLERMTDPACLRRIEALECHVGVVQTYYNVPLLQDVNTKCASFVMHGISKQTFPASQSLISERVRRVALVSAANTWARAQNADDWLRLVVIALAAIPSADAAKLATAALNNAVVDGCQSHSIMENALRLSVTVGTVVEKTQVQMFNDIQDRAAQCIKRANDTTE